MLKETQNENNKESPSPKKIPKSSKNVLYKSQITYTVNYPDPDYKGIRAYGNNQVKTSKYTPLNFVPFNLFYQLTKIANIYFIILIILQTFPAISLTNGIPTILPPLLFVILVSVIKDLIEDRKRWKKDSTENNSLTKKFSSGEFRDCKYRDLFLGEVIKIKTDEFIPADIILMETSDSKKNQCFIETKNLDGETNLNKKSVSKPVLDEIKKTQFPSPLEFIKNSKFQLSYEAANPHLYNFEGTFIYKEKKIALVNENIILRGCILRNTEWVTGIVCYNGHHSKIMKNSVKAKEKSSLLEVKMYKYIILVFCFLILFCFVCATLYIIWKVENEDSHNYLDLKNTNSVADFFIRFVNWILVFSNFVPISLVVTVETVKFLQAHLLNKSKKLIDYRGERCTANSSNLNEELGQIQYVFSDKTGTLTCNKMVFKKIIVGHMNYPQDLNVIEHSRSNFDDSKRNFDDSSIKLEENNLIETNLKNGKSYKITNNNLDILDNNNNDEEKVPDYINEIKEHVDFHDIDFFKKVKDDKNVQNVLRLLSVCHTVQKYNEKYSASSPDELALVKFAKRCGYEFLDINEDQEMVIKQFNNEKKYLLKNVLEFTSDRKRMSILVQDVESKKYHLFTKGADEMIFSISKKELKFGEMKKLKKKIDDYAKIGLRTLVLAEKTLTEQEYNKFKQDYDKASNNIGNREKSLKIVQDNLEKDLDIIGATAIEDQLQDEVPETIKFMREAGINVWVLTGDKVETAINIGFSSNLLSKNMTLIKIINENPESIKKTIKTGSKKIAISKKKKKNKKFAVIISGKVLSVLSQDEKLVKNFVKLILNCESVLCCRVSPKQKREIVDMVRKALPKVRTLAIGDGANDVNMIVGANVGIGIKGVEGQQAARASDYTIGEFRFLKTLLFNYGREYYRKNSNMVLYNFWKNIVLVVPQFWYAVFYVNFSGVTLYEANLYQYVNVFYTAYPIIIYCLYDKEVDSKVLLSDPSYYKAGIRNIHFNFSVFLVWFFFGITQAMIIALLVSFADYAPQSDGRYFGFWCYGIFVFMMTQIVGNFKIVIISNSFNFWIYFVILMGFLCFLISFFIVNLFTNNEHYGLMSVIFSSPIFYITFILVFIAVSFFDLLFHISQKILFFRYLNISTDFPTLTKKKSLIDNSSLNSERVPMVMEQDHNFTQENSEKNDNNFGLLEETAEKNKSNINEKGLELTHIKLNKVNKPNDY